MVFHRNLSDCKSPQVSRTLLGILADHNNAVVWMVSTRSLISKSFSRFTNPLVTVPSVPITTGITVTFMLNRFVNFQARSRYSSLFLQFYPVVGREGKVHYFLLIFTRFCRLAEIKRSICFSKSSRIL